MSLLEKICEELGVEVGKSWKSDGVHEYPKSYVIRNNTLQTFMVHYEEDGVGSCGKWVEASMADYVALIKGELKPIWKPKNGEKYYVPSFSVEDKCISFMWTNSLGDKEVYKRKVAFKTKEEAIEMANKMLKIIEEER